MYGLRAETERSGPLRCRTLAVSAEVILLALAASLAIARLASTTLFEIRAVRAQGAHEAELINGEKLAEGGLPIC